MRRDETSADVASVTMRVAVLLESGALPDRVFGYLAASDPADATIAHIADAVAAGTKPADALEHEGGAWVWIACAWRIAGAVGAPAAGALRSMARVATATQSAADDVHVALAEPAATARLMGWLPLVSVALGVALGFDTVGVLLRNPLGWLCLIAGLSLILLAKFWTARIISAARGKREAPGLREELMAIALAGGASTDRARQLVDDTEITELEPADRVEATLRLSVMAGVPAVDLLRASSAAALQRSRTRARLRAANMATRLMLPLGVCTLPAFLALGVAPLLISVISTTQVPL